MDRLPLVVVVGVQLAVGAGDRLGRLVRLEAPVERLVPLRHLAVSGSLVAEHQIVVCLQVLGVDGEHLRELGDRLAVLPLQEEEPADLVAHHAVAGVEGRRLAQVRERLVVAARLLERGAEEEVGLGEAGVDLEGLAQRLLGPGEVALREPRAADVHPPVRVGRLHPRDLRGTRPPRPSGRPAGAGRCRSRSSARAPRRRGVAPSSAPARPCGRTRTAASASAITVIGRSGMALTSPETSEVSPVKTQRPSSWPGAEREVAVLGVADAGEGPLRVPPGELPVVELRLQGDAVARSPRGRGAGSGRCRRRRAG